MGIKKVVIIILEILATILGVKLIFSNIIFGIGAMIAKIIVGSLVAIAILIILYKLYKKCFDK